MPSQRVENSNKTIEVTDLVKNYGRTSAVNGISFTVQKGEIVGFLGPNGAGKSTTMRILTGFMQATSGIVKICDIPVAAHPIAAKRKIGYMPENNPLPEDLRVREYLKWRAKLKEIPFRKRRERIEKALELCDLKRASNRIIGRLSKGYRQRVGIADAILSEPDIIIMDEPTIGLDPHQIVMIRDLIASLRGRMSMIISSHILPEIEMTCDRVIIINGGKIVAEGTPDSLRKDFISETVYQAEIQGDLKSLKESLTNFDDSLEIIPNGTANTEGFEEVQIKGAANQNQGERILEHLTAVPNLRVRAFNRHTPTLEEVFLAATRRSWDALLPDSDQMNPDGSPFINES